MLERYEINTGSENEPISVDKFIEQINKLPKIKPIQLTFTYSGLPVELIKECLKRLPPNTLGIDLGSLIRSVPYRHTRTLDEIEEICTLLPKQLTMIIAERILYSSPTDEQIKRFINALPKVKQLNLQSNNLYMLNHLSWSELEGVEILELREDWLRGSTWPPRYFDFLKFLPLTVTTLYIYLPRTDPERVYDIKRMREDFFHKLPPKIHTLGLYAFDFCEESEQFSVPSSVHTLKWFWHVSCKPELLTLISSLFIHTLDLSEGKLGDLYCREICKLMAAIPGPIQNLILDNNHFYKKKIPELVSILEHIPDTVTSISMKNNQLFHNKTLAEQDELLKALEPFRLRLILEDNGCDDLFRAAPPLLGAIKQHLISEDSANLIATYLGAKNPTFFTGRRSKMEAVLQKPETSVIMENN
ncbi:MAG: hypothetical protein Q8M40_06220 [Legionella sp.]|nr:hypothetical protein [Legionella sp.]